MHTFNLDAIIHRMHLQNRSLTRQIDPQSGGLLSFNKAYHGAHATIGSGSETPEGNATSEFIATQGYLYIAHRLGLPTAQAYADDFSLEPAIAATRFLIDSQHPSGLIDLYSTNYESAPDTSFAIQAIAHLLNHGAQWRSDDAQWDQLCELIETFIRRAVPGIVDGGFHTPNHRWVISGALALALDLVPNIPQPDKAATLIDTLLSEGIDIDAEGAYTEHSIGLYDAVCNTSFLTLYTHYPKAQETGILDAVIQNLRFDQYQLNSDGTADTSLSKRQDYGNRIAPLSLSASYMHASKICPKHSRTFSETAHFIWNSAALAHPLSHSIFDLNRLANAFLIKNGESVREETLTCPQMEDFSKLFPANRFWRMRRGGMSASVFADRSQLLNLNYYSAELAGFKINQAYFGAGKFIGDQLSGDSNGVKLISEGTHTPRRPGYDYALGQTAAGSTWDETFNTRPLREISPASGSLAIQIPADGLGLDIHYKSLGETEGVATQIALDFAPGGIWESENFSFAPQAGQVIFLKEGSARMRYGVDIIEIKGGNHYHSMWAMRDSEAAPQHVRILVTFNTPVDHCLRIRCHRNPTN